MAGNRIGGAKAAETNRRKYDQEYLEKYGMTFYQKNGQRGGKLGKTGGFASPLLCDCDYKEELHKKASCAGFSGGKKSRRT